MSYSGGSMADLNGFNLASSNVMPAAPVAPAKPVVPVSPVVMEEKKEQVNAFQPTYNESEFLKPGSIKISSVYESDMKEQRQSQNSLFAQSNKEDIIPKHEIEAVDKASAYASSINFQQNSGLVNNSALDIKQQTNLSVNSEKLIGEKNIGCGVVGDRDSTLIRKPNQHSNLTYKELLESNVDNLSEKEFKEYLRMQPMSVTRWMLSVIGLAIPGLNILLIIIWAFFKGNRARQNMCRAILIVAMFAAASICVVLYFVDIDIITTFFKDIAENIRVMEYIEPFMG